MIQEADTNGDGEIGMFFVATFFVCYMTTDHLTDYEEFLRMLS